MVMLKEFLENHIIIVFTFVQNATILETFFFYFLFFAIIMTNSRECVFIF